MSRADRLQGLVERGFEALDGDDLETAARSLEQARKISRDDAGVRLLEAAITDVAGNPQAAITIYEELALAHPDDPVPHLHAGATLLYSVSDPEAALVSIDKALQRVEDDAELIEAIVLKTRALAVLERTELAREALAELDSSSIDDPEMIDTIADAAMEANLPAIAERWWKKLTGDDDWAADAWYGIGAARELQRDTAGRIAAWQETRKRDAAAPAAEWHLSHDELDELVTAALAELPEDARARLANVPILIEDLPSEALVADGVDPRSLGLFSGTPMPAESSVGGVAELTTIHLFQKNLEDVSGDEEDLAEQIRVTVLHETAHFFGLDEDELEDLGLD
jgi:predicted Zn-dependent protease with MMP-like domain